MKIPPALGIACVLLALGALLGGLRWLQSRRALHPELVRKLMHVGMGLVALTFPRLFDQPWPVLVLSGTALALLAAVRWVGPLRRSLGSVLGGVERTSLGEFYFAGAVAMVFWLSRETNFPRGTNLFFIIPVLILTLADAVGALIGTRYGLARYTTDDGGHKSVEGSLAFFLAAFFSTHVPLLLCSDTGRGASLLIGVTLGLLLVLIEAIAWRGLDNLFIPLTAFIALRIYLHLSVPALVGRVLVLAGLILCLLIWKRHTYLNSSASLGAALVLYLSWSIGGLAWLAAPALLLAGYSLFCCPPDHPEARGSHPARGVLALAAGGLGWLFFALAFDQPDRVFPFYVAFAAQMALVSVADRLLRDSAGRPGAKIWLHATALGLGVVLAPCLLLSWLGGKTTPPALAGQAALGALVVAGATAAFLLWQVRRHGCEVDDARWLRQGAIGAAATLAVAWAA